MEEAHDSATLTKTSFWDCDENLRTVTAWIVIVQLLAAPAILLRDIMPPVIGIGWFSFAVDFRYFAGVLFGVSLALPVWFAFFFAWSDQPVGRRLLVGITTLLFASVSNVIFWLAYDSMITVGRNFQVYGFLNAARGLSGILMAGLVGVACFPLLIRAMRTWRITQSEPNEPLSPRERQIECALFGGAIMFSLVISPFVSFDTGIGPIAGVFGILFGMILSLFVFQLFREQSTASFCASVAIWLTAFVALPSVGVWLGDYSQLKLLPAGSGIYFVGLISGSVFFLAHALLMRKQGYRMRSSRIRPQSVQRVNKPVVDPFSD